MRPTCGAPQPVFRAVCAAGLFGLRLFIRAKARDGIVGYTRSAKTGMTAHHITDPEDEAMIGSSVHQQGNYELGVRDARAFGFGLGRARLPAVSDCGPGRVV